MTRPGTESGITHWFRLAALALSGLLAACQQPPVAAPSAELDYQRGRNALAEDRADWARIYFQRQLAATPDHVPSLRQLGLAWNSGYQQSLSAAIEAYFVYLKHAPADVEIRRRLVLALHLLGRREELAKLCGEVSSDLATTITCADPDLGFTSAARYAELSSQYPDHPAMLHTLARAAVARGDHGEALQLARRSLALDPVNPELQYLLSRLYAQHGETAAAQAALEQRRLALLVRDPEMPPEALAALKTLRETCRCEAYSLVRRWLQMSLQQPDASALGADPFTDLLRSPEVEIEDVLQAAVLAHRVGMRQQARELFAWVRARQAQNAGATTSLALLDLERGDLDSAESLIGSVLAEDPHFARAYVVRGRIALARDRLDEALDQYQRAVELAPFQPDWRIEWARLLLLSGQRDAARAALDAAEEATPAITSFRQKQGL